MGTAVFVGRQPVFDRRRQVFGYELLYRSSGTRNAFDHIDGDAASRHVMHNSLNVMAWGELVGRRRAFINITRQLLLAETYAVLPAQRVVVELLENIEPDPQVVDACRTLKQAGYMLALDDFVYTPRHQPLVELADILKVDFMAADAAQRAQYARQFGGGRLILLAEKVETPADFAQALSLGYHQFQGYFFCKPQIVEGRDVPTGKRNYLRFLQEVNRPQISFENLEDIVKHEVSLSSKLLRYLNSAAMGLSHKLNSIKNLSE